MRTANLSVVVLLLGACVAQPELERARRRPIVGGQAEDGYPAVGILALAYGQCTATLVAPRVVVSAKHCLSGELPEEIEFLTGRRGDHSSGRGIALFYRGGLEGEGNLPDRFVDEYTDVFAMALDRAPPIEPAPYRRTPVGEAFEREPGFIVGYGLTAAEGGSSGEKRSGPVTISDVQQNHPIIVTSRAGGEATGCWGDSGGPLFSDGQVTGVMTYFQNVDRPCDAGGRYLQLGAFADLVDDALRAAEEDGGGEREDPARQGGYENDDSCEWADDGVCDEPDICPAGTDTTDCMDGWYECDEGYCVVDDGYCDEDLSCCSYDDDCDVDWGGDEWDCDGGYCVDGDGYCDEDLSCCSFDEDCDGDWDDDDWECDEGGYCVGGDGYCDEDLSCCSYDSDCGGWDGYDEEAEDEVCYCDDQCTANGDCCAGCWDGDGDDDDDDEWECFCDEDCWDYGDCCYDC